jgi:lipoprotein
MKKVNLIIISSLLVSCSEREGEAFSSSISGTVFKIIIVSVIFSVIGALFNGSSKKENKDKENTNKE